MTVVHQPDGKTVVTESPQSVRQTWIILALGGAAILWGIQALSGWFVGIRFVPFGFLWRWFTDWPQPQASIAALVVGALLGLLLGLVAAGERLTVTVADSRVLLIRGEQTQKITRETIGGVLQDGNRLVFLDTDGDELTRERHDLDARELRAAFESHGYAWRAS